MKINIELNIKMTIKIKVMQMKIKNLRDPRNNKFPTTCFRPIHAQGGVGKILLWIAIKIKTERNKNRDRNKHQTKYASKNKNWFNRKNRK